MSAATKFFTPFETNTAVATVCAAVKLHPFHPLRFPIKLLSSHTPLHFRRFSSSSSSSASVIDEDAIVDSPQHPWPEWVSFVDRLKAKGYVNSKDGGVSGNDVGVYKDITVLKEACLRFSRDRFDLFNSLNMQDIQNLVEKGCPNINRKTVNSGKRLRAHLQLDEGDACGACILRGSCDRAYVILKDIKSDARTVDIVRILLNYALDPVVVSNKKLSGEELIEASARKLLLELTELGDTKIDPGLHKPAAVVARKVKPDESVQSGPSSNVEMKRGDWMCPKCNFMNFSRNIRCLKCKTEGPNRVGADEMEMKKGDWNCPQCQFMNFASNKKCLRCREQRPKRQLNAGEWECPSCDFFNYTGNVVCRKCNCERLKGVKEKYEEQMWRKPA